MAFRFPRTIHFYGLDAIAAQLVYELEIDEDHIQDPEDPYASEIHSMEILIEDEVPAHLLAGLRNGLFMNIHMRFEKEFLFFTREITRLGNSPVEFISGSHGRKNENQTFAMCEYLWEVRLEDKELKIEEVLFDDFRIVRCLKYDC